MKSAKIDYQKERYAKNEFEKKYKTAIINNDGALF